MATRLDEGATGRGAGGALANPGHDLSRVAAAARDSLRCAAVVITRQSEEGEAEFVAAEGIQRSEFDQIWPWLIAAGQRVESGVLTVEPETAEGPGVRAVIASGYRSVSSAPVSADGQRLGTLQALSRTTGTVDEVFVEVFAAHCATALRPRLARPAFAASAQRVERTTAFDHLALLVPEFGELIRRVTEAMSTAFGEVICGVMVWDEENKVLQMVEGSFGAEEEITNSYQINPRDLHSNAARVFEFRRSYMTNHAEGDPAVLQDYVEAFGIHRLLSVPLVLEDRATGVFHVANKASDFTVGDLEECEWLASRLALVIEMTRMLRRSLRQQRIEAILSRIAVAIAQGHPADRLLRESLAGFRDITETNLLALVPASGPPTVARASDVGSEAIETLVEEARGLKGERAHVVRPSGAGDPGSAVLHIPVYLGDVAIATLAVLRGRGERFDVDEKAAFARMANLVALAFAGDEVSRQRTALTRLRERERIADDLHDDSAQLLFAAQLQLDSILEREGVDADLRADVSDARRVVARADSSIRSVISELSRPSDETLPARIRDLTDGVAEEYGVLVGVNISKPALEAGRQLPRGISETLLRVARESLMNVAKHAGPCQVDLAIDLPAKDRIRLRIVDNGIGIDDSDNPERHGLRSLQQAVRRRGGVMRVRREGAGGTSVQVTFPL